MADETLNRDIAECLGWTDFWPSAKYAGQFSLLAYPPNDQSIDAERAPVPQYDTDPAACLFLLEHVLRQTVSNPVIPEQQEQFSVTDCSLGTDAWYFELCMESYSGYTRKQCVGEAIVLHRAMALACLEALRWLKEQTP